MDGRQEKQTETNWGNRVVSWPGFSWNPLQSLTSKSGGSSKLKEIDGMELGSSHGLVPVGTYYKSHLKIIGEKQTLTQILGGEANWKRLMEGSRVRLMARTHYKVSPQNLWGEANPNSNSGREANWKKLTEGSQVRLLEPQKFWGEKQTERDWRGVEFVS